jgi:methyl-accepting chemotaxis protein
MFSFASSAQSETRAKLAALDRVQAVIEFDLDGNILHANENFLGAMGYTLPEIEGKHHSIFVEPADLESAEHRDFWAALRAGEFKAGQFKRIGKGGREVWIEASYNPILDKRGTPCKVVKFATDITKQKQNDTDRAGQISAIRKSQAVIEFSPDGIVLDANENFLGAIGYSLDEIRGKHHGMFVDPEYRQSAEYAAFWQRLKRGEYDAAKYKRITKRGEEIWIQASYNPILDPSGRPYKIVKFATDITKEVKLLAELRRMIDQNFGEIDRAVVRSSEESESASNAASATANNVQAMATASEELASSIAEIAQSLDKSRTATDSASDQAKAAGDLTAKLSTAAESMGGIVSLIQDIAAQINLLALNATIESARAGEAGRGFAVVAQEVKTLASQAAKATDRISAEIKDVQSVSTEVVEALNSIKGSIDVMRENVLTTSSAVEEQNAVTRDLSQNMHGTARAVTEITSNISAISAAVTQVSSAVSTTRDAAKVLAR